MEATERELKSFDDAVDDDDDEAHRKPDASEDSAQRVIDEAEAASARFAESPRRVAGRPALSAVPGLDS